MVAGTQEEVVAGTTATLFFSAASFWGSYCIGISVMKHRSGAPPSLALLAPNKGHMYKEKNNP